jgi:hypothetical protein
MVALANGCSAAPADTEQPSAEATAAASRDPAAQGATLEEIRANYFAKNAPLPENKRVLCPFLRLMETSGEFYKDAKEVSERLTAKITVPVSQLVRTAKGFGCDGGCDVVATIVSAAQQFQIFPHPIGTVDISQLTKAKPVAHDCGLTFAKGDTTINEERRAQTLSALKERADAKPEGARGQLGYEDLYAVKLDTCNREGVVITNPSQIEVDLIYTYLGGPDRGYVAYEDVNRLLHAQLPTTKLKGPMTKEVLDKVASDFATVRVINQP